MHTSLGMFLCSFVILKIQAAEKRYCNTSVNSIYKADVQDYYILKLDIYLLAHG